MNKRPLAGALAIVAAVGIALTGCTANGDTGSNQNSNDSSATGSNETITLGYLPGWTDGLSLAYLLEDQLGKLGYDTEMEELTEASVLYIALAGGDIDIYTSAAPEKTHAAYMEKYGEDLEDLGT